MSLINTLLRNIKYIKPFISKLSIVLPTITRNLKKYTINSNTSNNQYINELNNKLNKLNNIKYEIVKKYISKDPKINNLFITSVVKIMKEIVKNKRYFSTTISYKFNDMSSSSSTSNNFMKFKLNTRFISMDSKPSESNKDIINDKLIKSQIFTIPNCITMSRIILSPTISYLLLTSHYSSAVILTFALGLTDFIDGYIARKYKMTSVLGSYLDPLADKIMVAVISIPLAYMNILNPYIVTIVCLRDLFLILGVGIYRFRELPSNKRTLHEYFNINVSTFQIAPNLIGKFSTFFQISWIFFGLATLLYPENLIIKTISDTSGYLVLLTTIASGASYALKRGMKPVKPL